ncbi:MAG: hypothetical protein P8Y98_13880 [Anaerolineales bacterium]|jgi:hypothetical protein
MTVRSLKIISCVWAIVLSACSNAAPTKALPTPQIFSTFEPTEAILPTEDVESPNVSFDAVTYRDDSAGFMLDYPAAWTADAPQAGGDRGYFAQITSWPRNPGELPEFVPEGGTILSITVLLWDPKNDLDAFITTRKEGWAASGYEIIDEQESNLAGNWRAFRYEIQTPVETTLFLFTTIGDRYLVLSGSGDLDLLSEIVGTLRPIDQTP